MFVSNFKTRFDKWARANDQHGNLAFQRFVMLNFLEALENISNDFVFKGGNLLWHYINTPRQTIDLDLATETIKSHLEVKNILESVTNYYEDISFKIKIFKEVELKGELGAAVVVSYKTSSGQINIFELDIVYALPTDLANVKSTLDPTFSYKSASLENIIRDKVAASWRFQSGNSRMKDFDDLLRISRAEVELNHKILSQLLNENSHHWNLDLGWIDIELEKRWSFHQKSYKDLPMKLKDIFLEINEWLANIKNEK